MKHSSTACWEGMTQCAIFWLVHDNHLVPIREGVSASKIVSSEAEVAPSNMPYVFQISPGEVPTLFVVVKSLPKEALIETQVLLHTTRKTLFDDDNDTDLCSMPRFSYGPSVAFSVYYP